MFGEYLGFLTLNVMSENVWSTFMTGYLFSETERPESSHKLCLYMLVMCKLCQSCSITYVCLLNIENDTRTRNISSALQNCRILMLYRFPIFHLPEECNSWAEKEKTFRVPLTAVNRWNILRKCVFVNVTKQLIFS